MACSAAPALTRGESISSMRKTTLPPADRAASQAIRYVRALPTCCAPVGEGASRPTVGETVHGFTIHGSLTTGVFGDKLQDRLPGRVVLLSDFQKDRHVIALLDFQRSHLALLLAESRIKLPRHLRQRQ